MALSNSILEKIKKDKENKQKGIKESDSTRGSADQGSNSSSGSSLDKNIQDRVAMDLALKKLGFTNNRETGLLNDSRYKNYQSNVASVDESYVNRFISDWNNYSNRAQTAYKGLNWKTATSGDMDSLSDTGRDLMFRSAMVRSYMNSNKDRYDEENYKGFMSQLDSIDSFQKDFGEAFTGAKKYYSQWETEEDYNKWLKYSTPEARQEQYAKNQERLEELKLQRNALRYQPGMNPYTAGIGPNTMPMYGAAVQNQGQTTEIDKEIAALEKEIRLYEYGEQDETGFYYGYKTADDYSKYLKDSRFLNASKNRNFQNPSRSELDMYDASTSEGSLALSNGGYFDENGNIRDAKGNVVRGTEPVVQDKLGLYLSANQDDITEAYSILIASNGNYDTSWADIIQEGDTSRWKFLKEDELSIYYGLLNTEGQEAAYRYLDAMEVELGRRELKQDYAYIDEVSGLEQIMLNAASVPMNMIGGIAATVDNAARLIQGKDINPYSRAQTFLATGNYIRSNTAQEIDEATGNIAIPGLGFSFGDAYQAGMAMVDTLVGGKIGGKAYQAMMSMSAASSEMTRLYSQGASTEQMVLAGVAAGAAEWVFEKYSIENLISLKSPGRKWQFVKNALIQGGIELSEEAATELANIISNGLIMQSESDWAQLLEKTGGDYGKALTEMAIQIANAGLGGFLSGVGSGAIQQGMQYGAQRQEHKELGQYISGASSTDALVALAQELAGVASSKDQKRLNSQSERLQKKFLTEGGKNVAVGRLYNTVQSVVTELNIDEISAALQEKGFSKKDAAAIAGAVAVQANGMELSDNQKKTLQKYEGNEEVKSVLDEILGNRESGINQRAKSVGKFEFDTMRNYITSQVEQAAAGQKNASASDTVDSQNKDGSESHYEVSAEGKTIDRDGNILSIKRIASIENGHMVLETEDGRTIDASDVIYGSKGEALIYETVARMGVTVDTANALVKGFDPGKGISESMYALDIQEAYNFGAYNYQMKISENDPYASVKKQAWNEGRIATISSSDNAQSDVETTFQKAKETLKDSSKEVSGDYHATLEDGITPLSLNESQKASYHLADQIAQAAKVNIRVYHGKNGEMGYYSPKTEEIYLNLNATNKSRKSVMAFVLGHELVHRAKNGSPAKYQKFADFLIAEYGKQGSDVEAMIAEQIAAAKEHGLEMTREKALEEVVADACQRMLLDTDAGKKLAAFGAESKQNKSFLEDVKRWISEFMDKLRKLFQDVEPDSMAAKEFAKFDENVKQILADMYVDMTIDAGEHLSTIKTAFGKGTIVETNENGEFTMAQSADGSEKVFNLVTWKNGGRETLEATLLREGYTEEEVKAALTIMDGKQELVERIANEVTDNGAMAFPEQGRINEVTLTTDLKDGHSVLTALVSNGDYPVNIDLLMICKKRKAYQRVINRLCETGMIKNATVDALAIAEINKILGKYGFETACLGCFVESRRLRIQEWAQTIVKEWNSEVKKRNPNAKSFGFGKGEAKLTPDEVMQLIGELESGGPKNEKGNLNLGQGSAVKRMGVLLDKVPSLRKTLSIEDLITPDGLAALRQFDSNLFSMVKSRYGSNSPKFVQEFNPYNHELAMYGKVPSEYKSLREYLYAIGGARMQSFSDFIVENWFDYCQIVADLSARKLPMHTYTKEIALAKLFGLTGIKINMSLIPDIDRSLGKEYAGLTRNAKGELELIWADKDRFKATGGKSYMQSINFADAIALQNDPRYSANVGTIAVGVSDKHILMMLDDARIRMVIPYHSSGMNPIFADMMGTSFYKDYTMFQNTTVKQLYNSKGQKVSLKLDKTQTGKLTSGFQFNEVLQELGDARAAAEAYKAWCADASKHTITIKGETYTAELTPKFDDFSGHENYYKLLEDFNPYDCITEEAAPQGDVQQIYPDGFEDILRAELSGQEKHRQKQEKNQAFDKAMGEIESYLKDHTKADTVHYANQHGIKLGAKDKKLDAAGKERLKRLQQEGASFMLPKTDSTAYKNPAYHEWDVQAALYDALDHTDKGYENMIRVGEMPRYITEKIGIEGDFYIYRNHAYENMVSREQAIKDGRPVVRKGEKIHFHDLGVDTMTEAIMSLENPIMTIATKTKDGNPAVIMLLPIEGKNKAPLYAVLSFYSNRHINGDISRRPHVVLTIAEREFFGSKGRSGYAEIVGTAVKDGRVIDFNKKMRDDLSVIANPAGVGNITDTSLSDNLARFRKEIKTFREKNKIDYKLPVGEDTSPRALLANAFEGVVKDSEKQKIQEYKKQIAVIEAEEQKLRELRGKIKDLSFAKGPKDTKAIRSLQFEANQTANRISTYDKQLLRLEASKPLQDVLNREKELVRKREQQRNKEALAAYREKATKTQRELMDKWQESRKKGVENREKTAMRHKIQNVVGELNTLLLSNDKKRHVPESLKKAVADALALVNMDTVGAEERAAKYAALIAKETDPDKIDAYTVTMENILRQGEKMGQKLKDLRDAYEEISESDDPDIANAYDPVIAGCLKELSQSIGNTSLRNMTIEQLSDVYDMYRMVLTRVRDANKSLVNEKKESISNLASRVVGEVRRTGGEHKYRAAILDAVKKFGWNNLKPVYAFEHIGSSTLTEAYNNVRDGEDVWAKDVTEAREYYLDKAKKYGYDSWDFKKKYRFESDSGLEFELTLEQILSLYAYSKREQAHEHLRLGGFVFDSNIETYTEKGSKILKYKVNTADAHQITTEILADIIGKLTQEQAQFVDEMQEYLSTAMGAKGNEVTMKMYGVKLFKEKFYFPLKSAKQFMFEQNEVSGEVKIKNSGFTNKTVAKANNPVILSNFMDVWSGHVNDMSMYHAFVIPLEDFNRIFNYNSPKKEGQPPVSVKGTIQSAYSPAAVSYVKNLITDLNGGARTDSTTGIINKMMGLFKKGAVFASLSVVVQQPSAIARAAALVDTKYFIGPKVDRKRHKLLWNEVKQYAPVAIIKEMGYFDTNMGKSTQDFILSKDHDGWLELIGRLDVKGLGKNAKDFVVDSDYRDEVLSWAPAFADELAWCSIWEAVKRETKAKNPGMDVKSEAFLQKAGKRFTEVITKTQVYDSVLSRSANMRSKDTGMKMATSFMAEPTTSINMIADALLQGKRGNRKYARTAIGAVIASQIFNSILVSFVYAGRDDDEDKTYWEKYIGTLSGEIIDSMNPAGYIPFIKDIMSIVQGYEVERSDMAVVSDLWNAWQKLGSDNVSVYRKVEGFAGSIAQIFGLPVKNIMRDARGIWQTIVEPILDKKNGVEREPTTKAGIGYAVKSAIPAWMGGGDVSNQNQLYEAYLSGDKTQISRVEGRYKDQSAINSAIRKALRENDPRIRAAAEARASGNLAEYTRLAKEIIGEKHFSQDNVVAAINAEINAMDKEETTTSTAAKASGLYKAEDFAVAASQGNAAMANAIKSDIIQTAQKNGKTAEEAEKSFNTSAKSELKEMFLAGEISEQETVKALTTYCGAEENAAKADVQYWVFKDKYPNINAEDSWFDAYYEDVADTGLDIGIYMEYRNEVREITGKDKKERRMEIIDSLPISSEQKDALYYAEGWAASKISQAPWH